MTSGPATPRRELKKLWCEWIELHAVLEREISDLAAPFFSACSRTKCNKRILLVGKATDRDWRADSYRDCLDRPIDEVIQERLRQNLDLVQSRGNGKAFWNFFCRLADINSEFGLDSIIWSNVAKIGRMRGNPRGKLLSRQVDLAIRTLRAEIREYHPALIFFVTGSDPVLSCIIHRTLGTLDCNWIKSDERSADVPDVWWRSGEPAALWTRHPQGAHNKEKDYWVKRARKLIG